MFSFVLISIFLLFDYSHHVISQQSKYRLPDDLSPDFYRLHILTNLGQLNQEFSFFGTVNISIHCVNTTDKIILHSKNLIIYQEKVHVYANEDSLNNQEIKIINQTFNDEYDFYIIVLDQSLTPGYNYSVVIPFKGELTQGLAGYYRSSYLDPNTDEERWLAVTQFSPTDARKAFPCFDEPKFKARFKLSIGHKLTHHSLSNTEIESTENIQQFPGWVWDNYKTTLPMSTYIVAYMVSDYGNEEPPDQTGVRFRVWTKKHALNQVEHAAVTGPKLLEFCESYFEIPYPLPKIDMAAIPDFHYSAMENWGLITFSETTLLYDINNTAITNLQSMTFTMGHEIVHQWFGNLVTMYWWSDLWLKEGFATYIGSLAVHAVHPEWAYLDNKAVDDIIEVFSLDALNSSHPVSVPLENPQDVGEIFDSISYEKGSLVLRMISHLLGSDVFRKGIINYLNRFAYSNAEKDDLWESLNDAAGNGNLPENVSVKTIMDTWISQTGYPVVSVTRDYAEDNAIITQHRFMLENITVNNEVEPCWYIQLTYSTKNRLPEVSKTWMTCTVSSEVLIDNLPKDDWIIFNIDMAGLYRTNYDATNWKLLSKTLNSPNYVQIPVLNRVQILNDVLSLARTGEVDYNTAIDIVSYLYWETEYLPWKAGINGLDYINQMVQFSPSDFQTFRSFVSPLISPLYSSLSQVSYPETPEYLQQLRHQTLIICAACEMNVGDCQNKSADLFKEWLSTTDPDVHNPISQDLRPIVYRNAIQAGGELEWNFLWERFRNADVEAEKSRILSSLGATPVEKLIIQYLEWSIDESSGIRFHQSRAVFVSVASETIGYPLARQFFFTRFDDIHNYYALKLTRLSSYIEAVSAFVTTEAEYNELYQFFTEKEKLLKENKKAVDQGLEKARINVQWQQKFRDSVLYKMQ